MAFWRPVEQLDEESRRRGLTAFLGDGICSQVRESLHSGPLLVGYALLLGVSNGGIGLLAALGPLTQVLQLPTVALIERWRARKVITWWAALADAFRLAHPGCRLRHRGGSRLDALDP